MKYKSLFSIMLSCSLFLTAGTIDFASYQTLPAGESPEVVASGDINDDTRIDAVVAQGTWNDTLYVFLQNAIGNLVFSAKYPAWDRAEGIDIGDINNDNRNDIVIADFANDQLVYFLQNASGTFDGPFVHPAANSPDGVKIGDINSDNRNDVVVCHWNEDSLGVFYQNASGNLDPMTTYYAPHAGYDEVEIGDIDNDSDLDVVFMRGQLSGDHILVFKQNASGTLDPHICYDVPSLPHGIAIGDLNNDNRNDLAVTYGGNQPSSKLGVFYQDTAGSLSVFQEYPAYDIPEPVEIADFDLDGRNDVALLNGGWMRMSVYQQNASGSLNPYQLFNIPYASHYNPQGLDIGDINNDGKPDVVIADYNNGLVYLINASLVSIAENTQQKETQSLWTLPNPSSGALKLQIPSEFKDKCLLMSVYTVDGREIHSAIINKDAGFLDKMIIEPGIYFIKVSTENEIIFSQKIVRF
jgi:hypothetical protein